MIKLEHTIAYTAQEAAEILHISLATARKYMREGSLKARKVGKSYYVTDDTLTEFITGERPKRF